MSTDYPSNSRLTKSETKEEPADKKLEKVVEGKVVRRKKPWGKRMLENFVGGEDANSVFGYILQDVIVPATKDLVSDAVSTAVERMLFGESVSGRRRGRSHSSPGRTDYNGISTRNIRRDEPRREMSQRAREQHDFDEIQLDSRVDAENVLEQLYECLDKFDVVTVSDLYSLIGTQPSHVDRKWGWEGAGALQGSRVVRIKGGYLIDLPRPQYLN